MSANKTIEQRIEELERRVAILENSPLSGTVVTTPKIKRSSAKEFLMSMELNKETQKTVALGYYLEHVEGMESFNVTDLEAVFRSAKEKLPKNINDAVNKNIARGLLMEAGEKKDTKKAWVLTSTGEKFIEEELKKFN